jgi:ankyrin repeat protein
MARLLLQSGTNLTERRERTSFGSFTPLEIAIRRWKFASEVVGKLLAAGALMNSEVELRRALAVALKGTQLDVAKFSVSRGIDINKADGDGYTLLHAQNEFDLIAFLIANWADVNASSSARGNEGTSLHIAIENSRLETVKTLLEFGADRKLKQY